MSFRTSNIAIIGAGVVGTAIGYLLKQSGYSITGIGSRLMESAGKARDFIGQGEASTDLVRIARNADIVFITTSDDAIEQVCNHISGQRGFKPGSLVAHTSGALPVEVLDGAKQAGALTVCIHPLQSLPSVQEALRNISGSYFCLEGDSSSLKAARELVKALNGLELTIAPGGKSLYHAGAAAVSNFLVATIGFGLQLHEAAGINRRDSLNALLPLIRGTLKNVEQLGIPDALTGPIARGDVHTVQNHLHSIEQNLPELLGLYAELGRYTLGLALEKGSLDSEAAQKIRILLEQHCKG